MARVASRDCLRLLATWPLGLTQAVGTYCEAGGLTADGDVATWLTQAAGGCREAGARREAGDVMSLVTWFLWLASGLTQEAGMGREVGGFSAFGDMPTWADVGGGHAMRCGRLHCRWRLGHVA